MEDRASKVHRARNGSSPHFPQLDPSTHSVVSHRILSIPYPSICELLLAAVVVRVSICIVSQPIFRFRASRRMKMARDSFFRCLILLLFSFGWGCYSRTHLLYIYKEQMKMHFNIIWKLIFKKSKPRRRYHDDDDDDHIDFSRHDNRK